MRQELRLSLPARLTALSFIVLIVIGNLWLLEGLLGKSPPRWLQLGFLLGCGGVLVGGVGLGFVAWRLHRQRLEE